MDIVNLKVWILLICARQVLKFRKILSMPGSLIGFMKTELICTLVDIFRYSLPLKRKPGPFSIITEIK